MSLSKKSWAFIVILLLVVGGFFSLRSCKSSTNTANQEAIVVKKGTIDEKVTVVGNIIPKHTISVKSTMPGIVGNLFHEEGDYVEQGALLLQILPSPTPQSVAEAHAAVKENSAIVKHAAEHKNRIEQLLKLKIETPQNYSLAVKDLATAEAKLEMAQQKLALLQKGETTIAGKNIKTTIASPISGYILQRNVDVGEPVVPLNDAQEGTVLFVIANMQDLIFKGLVNEIDVAKISPQMIANISIAALPDIKVKGALDKIGLQSNAQDASRDNKNAKNNDNSNSPFNVGFNVELTQLQLPKDISLRAGYSATAEIIVKHLPDVLVIPERVLIFKDDKVYVNLADKDKKTSKEQEVKIGASDGINVEVLNGLSAGQTILDNPVASN